jgi:hypothetical protein
MAWIAKRREGRAAKICDEQPRLGTAPPSEISRTQAFDRVIFFSRRASLGAAVFWSLSK